MTDRELDGIFAELREEEAPPEIYAALRRGVMVNLDPHRSHQRRWIWLAAPAFAVLALALLFRPQPAPKLAPAPAVIPVAAWERREPRPLAKIRRVRTQKPQALPELRVEMQTSDPNIKIIWLIDAQGE